jgi:hypothetical protein
MCKDTKQCGRQRFEGLARRVDKWDGPITLVRYAEAVGKRMVITLQDEPG